MSQKETVCELNADMAWTPGSLSPEQSDSVHLEIIHDALLIRQEET